MTDQDGRAEALQSMRNVVALEIGALHFVAQVQQYFRDAAHADAADADEVNAVDAAHAIGHRAPPAAATQASARRTSASVIANARALVAISTSFGRPPS